ncbi:hypothetical protein ACTI_64940 [Actinoplanes sp. OR16]|uniref:hypothetical protein n=1 Tax=Actinoplanes sp. OR16 TaxID=946334 RepID=UPI000F7038D3|nr:hypothetical protein [Actinoplanes sp. OR16]BBH69809.1 hypothetical protein ACTI_64940 [Actinoplanes sp. OR16]
MNPPFPSPLFLGLFDDAAIFPPGDLPLPDAVKAHRERAVSPLAPLLGPFVCSAARLDALALAVSDPGWPPLPVSLTVPAPVPGLAVPAASGPVAIVEVAAAMTGIDLVAVEGPGLDALPGALTTYREMPLAEITVPRLAALRDAGVRLKIRTGGVRAEAFPAEHDLAAALWSAARAGCPFKLTAGLHDPVRHRDATTGFEHHGFLNVLLATAHAVQGGDIGEVAAALADQDAHRVAAAITTIDAPLAQRVRELFVSFGTCSVSEPVGGLSDLGLLPEELR